MAERHATAATIVALALHVLAVLALGLINVRRHPMVPQTAGDGEERVQVVLVVDPPQDRSPGSPLVTRTTSYESRRLAHVNAPPKHRPLNHPRPSSARLSSHLLTMRAIEGRAAPALAALDLTAAGASAAEVSAGNPSAGIAADPLALRPVPSLPKAYGHIASGPPRRATLDEGLYLADIADDGSVRFTDRPSVTVKFPLIDKLRPSKIRQTLAAWIEDPQHVSESYTGPGLSLIDVEFDLTEVAMRGRGQDPYAPSKRAFLDRTRPARLTMAAAARTEALQTSAAGIQDRLEGLWGGPGSPAERRALLFALWDECAETGTAEQVSAARVVRAAIVGFVRRRLPPNSVDEFASTELDALNRQRSSKARFEP